MYSDKVIEHFMCPQNSYSMPDADAEGTFGESYCGDTVTFFIKVRDSIIDEVSYLVYGCPASVASSSMTSVMAKGKSLDEALRITQQDVADALGGLPQEKMHCSNLGVGALRKAIEDYRSKRGYQSK